MPDYGNLSTPLTAARYQYSATFIKGPAKSGYNEGRTHTGAYVPPRGATVGLLLEELRTRAAHDFKVSAKDVVLVSYSLHEC
ncbi:hypothetical protein ACFYWD_21040 [Streptomyces sp. NPDC003781]|uniref:hypothetical protein n=1 Tax=Streptomyces sp. NPDC003781 TaxID=3364686 RepID=UPI0036A39E77